MPARETLTRRLEALRERIARTQSASEGTATATPEAAEEEAPEHPSTVPAAPLADGGGANLPAIAAFTVAGVGLVGAAIFGALTLAEDSSLASSECGQAMTCTADDTSKLTTLALFTDISFGVALAGAAAGTIFLFALDGGSESEQPAASISPVVGPGVVGVAAGGAM